MKKTIGSLAIIVVILVSVITVCPTGRRAEADPGPIAAEQGLAADGDPQISAKDRCPVCGMLPARRPKAAAAMSLTDGRAFYFCGNGCLLRAWRHSRKHLGVAADTIKEMRVRDYFTGATIDARAATWIAGSDVTGPMGPAIVAVKDKAHVQSFRKRHGGRHVFQLDKIDDSLWDRLFSHKKP